ncbi:MAG: pyruvate:ferredoxin (flavodoxin) oxidoreductase, partial [Clostridia bacterium]|nr:pyruvate:ferredoxin (flavodoxin) oxidoreductase [Clostridia bacterium]
HAAIRPVLIDENTATPETFVTKPALGIKGAKYRIQISPLDCSGCGSCANVCIAKEKALTMVPAEQVNEEANFNFSETVEQVESGLKVDSVKGSQFKQPLFEYSGACAGCGETPYVKLATQMFGDRMIIANATGCSSIYGGSAPTCPYSVNKEGHGPAWANSLFEDNSQFGFGMNIAYTQRRNKVEELLKEIMAEGADEKFVAAANAWIENKLNAEGSKKASKELKAVIADMSGEKIEELKKMEDCFVKKSFWILGGDGWAYDIGYGGLDHVLAQNEDVNILVLDTEVYSNTGGQASKSTPTGGVAKFAAAGKRTKKKDLGMMAMSYGYVYVAQVGMGANYDQVVKAFAEAEAYNGPSLIIAYAPCINHGIDMSNPQSIIKEAVDCGYWQLYRYNPMLAEQGKNPFTLDSKKPTGDYQEFLRKETRFTSLLKTMPEVAEQLFAQNEKDSQDRLARYESLAKND